jgi:type I restriction enzyme, S subunit
MEVKAGYKQTDVGVIPENWKSTTVQGLAASTRNAIVGGPFGSDLVSLDYVDDGVPVIRGQNLGLQYISGNFVFVTSTKAKSLEANLARPDDIVFTQRGSLGQVSIVPKVPYDRYLISQSQMKLTVDQETADPLFFYYVFSSSQQQDCIRQNTIQTGVPHINLGILRGIPVQFPPFPEQCAIATALSDVDALISSLDKLIAKKRDIKQAAMQELLTGKRRLPGFSGAWERKRIEDVFTIFVGRSKRDQIVDGGRYWVADMGSVSTEGRLIVSKTTNCHDDFLRFGDLIMPKDDIGGGNIIGKVGYIDIDKTYVLGDHVFALRSKLGMSLFFSYVINGYKMNSELRKKVSGSAQLGISKKSVQEQEIPYPTVEEQAAIATVLTEIDAELTALVQKRDKTKAIKQGMMQELLTGRVRLT